MKCTYNTKVSVIGLFKINSLSFSLFRNYHTLAVFLVSCFYIAHCIYSETIKQVTSPVLREQVKTRRQLIETHYFPFRVQLKSLSRKKRFLNTVPANPIADKTALQQNDATQARRQAVICARRLIN